MSVEEKVSLKIRVPGVIKKMLWDLTEIEVEKERVKVASFSDICREALYRGMREMLEERKERGVKPRQELLG